jgi:zinc protease
MSPVDRALAPTAGPLRPFSFPRVERGMLPNGVALLAARSGDLPLVSVELVLDAGAMHDPAGQGGVASITASLLESGTATRSAEQIALAVDGLGVSLEVGASWDAVTVGFTGLSSRLEEGFSLLADLVREPIFPEHEVDRLKAERLGTLQHRRSDPGSLAAEVFHLYAFAPGSPFARPISGTRESITALNRDASAAFHAARYGPRGSTLLAAGDISLDQLAALAERFLGDWTGGAAPTALPAADPGVQRTTIVVAHRKGAVQSEIRLGHVGVERSAPDYAALQVMNAVLGGTFSSRLNLNLRERLGYTYGASSAWTPRRVPGVFTMSAAVQTEATAHSVSEMLREIRGMQAAPPSDAEVGDARSYLAGVLPLTVETTAGVAARLATIATYGLPDGYWDDYRSGLLAVTPADALAVAQRRLTAERAVVAVTADAELVREGLQALGEGPVEVVDPAAVLR